MESNKVRVLKRIVSSLEEARFVLDMVYGTGEMQGLQQGVGLCLSRLGNPRIDGLFERYPELLQQHGVKEMLAGGVAIDGYTEQEIKTAALLSGVQMVLLFHAEIRQQKEDAANMQEMLRYIIGSVPCGDWLDGALQMVTGIVGPEYYGIFQDRIATMGTDLRQLEGLAQDPVLQPHLDLMTWFCLLRLFLESVYALYEMD